MIRFLTSIVALSQNVLFNWFFFFLEGGLTLITGKRQSRVGHFSGRYNDIPSNQPVRIGWFPPR
jgi:hypothetical protein